MVSFGVDLKMFERGLLLMFSWGINLQLFILREILEGLFLVRVLYRECELHRRNICVLAVFEPASGISFSKAKM